MRVLCLAICQPDRDSTIVSIDQYSPLSHGCNESNFIGIGRLLPEDVKAAAISLGLHSQPGPDGPVLDLLMLLQSRFPVCRAIQYLLGYACT